MAVEVRFGIYVFYVSDEKRHQSLQSTEIGLQRTEISLNEKRFRFFPKTILCLSDGNMECENYKNRIYPNCKQHRMEFKIEFHRILYFIYDSSTCHKMKI